MGGRERGLFGRREGEKRISDLHCVIDTSYWLGQYLNGTNSMLTTVSVKNRHSDTLKFEGLALMVTTFSGKMPNQNWRERLCRIRFIVKSKLPIHRYLIEVDFSLGQFKPAKLKDK